MAVDRRDFLRIAGLAGAGTALVGPGPKAWSQAPALGGKFPEKVIILGFDGANPAFVEKWMDDGRLPNLAKLRAKGTYARISTANPPQTPVSWASFATGFNPGKTGLFDFLRRDPETYLPTLA
ncbi:MAG: alkaline phosphatase family protein, partial [Planctomycetes bacterium]|nr:alkaline phosphatase family protein [Planctomycetota bacterium]